MFDNKLVKAITDAATITDLVAGIGWYWPGLNHSA